MRNDIVTKTKFIIMERATLIQSIKEAIAHTHNAKDMEDLYTFSQEELEEIYEQIQNL